MVVHERIRLLLAVTCGARQMPRDSQLVQFSRDEQQIWLLRSPSRHYEATQHTFHAEHILCWQQCVLSRIRIGFVILYLADAWRSGTSDAMLTMMMVLPNDTNAFHHICDDEDDRVDDDSL